MNPYVEEKRSQGPLIAFIDLLFLLVAFLVLVLFFMQMNKTDAEVELERVQEKLAVVEEKKTALEETLSRLAPVIEQFTLQKRKEAERRRAEAARELRRRQRSTVMLRYHIESDGMIRYDERRYTLEQFRREVVEELRRKHWIAFRAFAEGETPFGTVVAFRQALLKDSNEFDTYWDNVTRKEQ